jgi:hypothetical protein
MADLEALARELYDACPTAKPESTTPPNSTNWMELAKAGSPVDQAQ